MLFTRKFPRQDVDALAEDGRGLSCCYMSIELCALSNSQKASRDGHAMTIHDPWPAKHHQIEPVRGTHPFLAWSNWESQKQHAKLSVLKKYRAELGRLEELSERRFVFGLCLLTSAFRRFLSPSLPYEQPYRF